MAGYPACYFEESDDDNIPTIVMPCSQFGPSKKKSRSGVCQEPALECRRRAETARRQLVEGGLGETVARPVYTLLQLQQNLNDKGPLSFFFNQSNVYYFNRLLGGRKYKLEQNEAFRKVLANIEKFRIMSVDTENKEAPIFLIVGDIEGNVLLFSDAKNIPFQFDQALDDVRIYKVQSEISEDYKVMKTINIPLTGTSDSQVIFGSFVCPEVGSKVGTSAQCISLGFPDVSYKDHRRKMNFSKGGKLTSEAKKHATEDARVPFLTLFKAAELHVLAYPVAVPPEGNVFDVLFDVLIKTAGVSHRVLQPGGWPMQRTIKDNWDVSRHPRKYDLDLNCDDDVSAIQAAQSDFRWNRSYKTAVKSQFTQVDKKRHHNRERREKWHRFSEKGQAKAKKFRTS